MESEESAQLSLLADGGGAQPLEKDKLSVMAFDMNSFSQVFLLTLYLSDTFFTKIRMVSHFYIKKK